MVNRWNTRNMMNKKDVFEIKKGLDNNYQLLRKINKKIDETNKRVNEELQRILENCEVTQEEYGNIEVLLKTLMVDSLLKEIDNEGRRNI